MTDDHNARFRSPDPHDRPPEPGGPSNDPLAELARLIGRNDPFAELGRESRAAMARETHREETVAPAGWHEAPVPSQAYDPFAQPAPQPTASDPHYAYAVDPRDRFHDRANPAAPAGYDVPPAVQDLADAAQMAPQMPAVDRDASYATRSAELAGETLAQEVGYAAQAAAEDIRHLRGYGPMPSHADEFYDDAPTSRRSRGWVTVLTVLGLAALGSGAAFAYRVYFQSPGAAGPPPIIRASAEPTKVAPPPAKNDTTSSKISYDRFGDRSQNERVVVREEKPIDPKDLATASPPATVTPAVVPVPPAPAPMPAAAAQASANPPSVLTEPKRVRTVSVRPDQPDPAALPQSVTPPRSPRQAAPVAAAPAARNAPLDVTPQAMQRPQPRSAAPRAAPAPAHNPNAPLSLAPDGNAAPPPRAARNAAPPMRIASTPPTTTQDGRYLVQVSSQRSEADAQASFRSIRSRYSSVLGNREPVIRRADLGSRGIYYRAMVGPFPTRDQAVQLCASLKAAGGDCVVQSN
jgi:hypothetical protein